MELGEYIDGQMLTYDEGARTFALDGAPIGADKVRVYAATRQIAWASPNVAEWFEGAFPPAESRWPSTPQVGAMAARTLGSDETPGVTGVAELATKENPIVSEVGEERSAVAFRDHSGGGYAAACVAEGIAFFVVREPAGFGLYAIYVLVGMFAYVAYTAFRKSDDQGTDFGSGRETWDTGDIWVAFLVGPTAAWAPMVLSAFFN